MRLIYPRFSEHYPSLENVAARLLRRCAVGRDGSRFLQDEEELFVFDIRRLFQAAEPGGVGVEPATLMRDCISELPRIKWPRVTINAWRGEDGQCAFDATTVLSNCQWLDQASPYNDSDVDRNINQHRLTARSINKYYGTLDRQALTSMTRSFITKVSGVSGPCLGVQCHPTTLRRHVDIDYCYYNETDDAIQGEASDDRVHVTEVGVDFCFAMHDVCSGTSACEMEYATHGLHQVLSQEDRRHSTDVISPMSRYLLSLHQGIGF